MMKKKFWEAWADTEVANARLGITIYALIGLAIILAIVLVRISTKPTPIYYIPGAEKSGISYPGKMPDECIGDFAENFVQTLANFTPATIDEVYKITEKYLSPSLLSKTRAGLNKEIARVKENSLSSLFSIDTSPIVEKRERGYLVKIAGQKVIYMGKDVMSNNRTTYTISLREVKPTEVNPYGLQIVGVSQEATKEET